MLDVHPQTIAARGRRRDRPAGKSRMLVCMDEWLYAWVKREALAKKRSLSSQAEMMLVRFAEGKIK